MTRRTMLRAGTVVTTAAALAAGLAGSTHGAEDTSAGRASHVNQAISSGFPDPGFSTFDGRYYLYSTGDGFPAATSTKPQSGYVKKGATSPLGNYPAAWNGVAPKWGRHHWAPEVFKVTSGGKPLYVMYFTAYNTQGGWNKDCVAIATSRSPLKGFRYNGTRICSGTKGFEAIDPTMYRAKDGKRYLVFKKGRYTGGSSFSIVSVPVDAATGTKVLTGGKRKTLAHTTSSETMEAPSFVAHGGKVWMFVSRGSFEGSRYRTEVWSAPSFQHPGGFTKVKNLTMNNRKGQPFISPGGASVLQDGKTTRIAFHATLKGTDKRQAYVGVIRWDSSGKPYLY